MATVLTTNNVIAFNFSLSNSTFKNDTLGVFVVGKYQAYFVFKTGNEVTEMEMSSESHTELVRAVNEEREPDASKLFSATGEFYEDKTLAEVVGALVLTLP